MYTIDTSANYKTNLSNQLIQTLQPPTYPSLNLDQQYSLPISPTGCNGTGDSRVDGSTKAFKRRRDHSKNNKSVNSRNKYQTDQIQSHQNGSQVNLNKPPLEKGGNAKKIKNQRLGKSVQNGGQNKINQSNVSIKGINDKSQNQFL